MIKRTDQSIFFPSTPLIVKESTHSADLRPISARKTPIPTQLSSQNEKSSFDEEALGLGKMGLTSA